MLDYQELDGLHNVDYQNSLLFPRTINYPKSLDTPEEEQQN